MIFFCFPHFGDDAGFIAQPRKVSTLIFRLSSAVTNNNCVRLGHVNSDPLRGMRGLWDIKQLFERGVRRVVDDWQIPLEHMAVREVRCLRHDIGKFVSGVSCAALVA